MTNGEKHIEKLLSWYKEAVTEDGVCYLTCDDKNTLAYAIKCCNHFEDIKKDIDSWMLREELSSSEKPNKSIEEKCPCYHCEYFEIKGWSHCKIHEDAYGDSRCNDYHKVSQDLTKVKQDSNRSEIPTGSDDCISRFSAKQIIRNHYCSIPSKVFKKIIEELDNISSATPIRPKGHWIARKKVGFGEWKDVTVLVNLKGCVTDSCECSECGDWLTGSDEYECSARYCPNCGAEMESEVGE